MFFKTDRASVLDTVTRSDSTVPSAVQAMISHEEDTRRGVPELYVSTAISSGGHYWNPVHDENLGRIIDANNETATLFAAEVHDAMRDYFNPTNVMLPTELGKVYFNRASNAKWLDSDYMLFYVTWLSGLSVTGTVLLVEEMVKPMYSTLLDVMNGRDRPHDERWPSYQMFMEIVCSKISLVENQPRGRRSEGSHSLIQLVDTNHSLGARAEALFAEVRDLEIVAPLFRPERLKDAARASFELLTGLAPPDKHSVNVGAPHDRAVSLVEMNPR